MATDTKTLSVDVSAPLTLAVDADQDPIASEGRMTYTLSYGNTAGANSTATTLSFPLPAGSTFVSATFGASPVTLSQSQTRNGGQAVITRQRNGTSTGFEIRLQEEESNDDWHLVETIGYVAVAP